MKSFFSHFTTATATLSLLATAQVALSSSSGPSCGAPKADDSYLSVVGVQGTGIHPRQEIRDLEKDTETWNLYIQALCRFQSMDEKDKSSYYQVSGIHGVPFQEWDGVSGQENQHMMGYCPHTSSLFGSWHRPYLALFEQILHDRAVDVANEYPEGAAREKAMQTADKIRLPYWDWAVNPGSDGAMPSILRRPTVMVTFPNGTNGELPNPLYRYDFHPVNYDDFAILSEFEFKDWNHTLRSPLNPSAINATSRDDDVNARLVKQQPNLRDMVYKLLTTYQPFNQVSNKANGGTIGNFETLHDGIHSVFGLGHMGIIEVSAFDPVFWLHHCNMDRIVTMYQTRYPETWIEASEQKMGTFTIKRGESVGLDSPLTPFHMNADGDMWTSRTVRNWTSFGYTYPELIDSPSNETFTATLNKLYKPASQGLNDTDASVSALDIDGNKTDTQVTDWSCQVNMPSDIKISYSVNAFLGDPPTNPEDWPTSSNYIGQLASMSSARMKTDVIITGNIGLSERLAQKYQSGELKSMEKVDVAAYLKDNFHWRIQALDFTEIPRNNPPAGLNVTVYNVPVKIPESDTQVPTQETKDIQYNHDIDGNPPIYNGPGIDGTNSTAPASPVGGSYNVTSGEFEWRNAKHDDEQDGMSMSMSMSSSSSSWSTQFISRSQVATEPPAPVATNAPDTPPLDLPGLPDPLAPIMSIITSVASAIRPAMTAAPDTTPAPDSPGGPQTRYVTEVVVVTM